MCIIALFTAYANTETFEFHPSAVLSDHVCGRRSAALTWLGAAGERSAITRQLIVQQLYMLQFKVHIDDKRHCGYRLTTCMTCHMYLKVTMDMYMHHYFILRLLLGAMTSHVVVTRVMTFSCCITLTHALTAGSS